MIIFRAFILVVVVKEKIIITGAQSYTPLGLSSAAQSYTLEEKNFYKAFWPRVISHMLFQLHSTYAITDPSLKQKLEVMSATPLKTICVNWVTESDGQNEVEHSCKIL